MSAELHPPTISTRGHTLCHADFLVFEHKIFIIPRTQTPPSLTWVLGSCLATEAARRTERRAIFNEIQNQRFGQVSFARTTSEDEEAPEQKNEGSWFYPHLFLTSLALSHSLGLWNAVFVALANCAMILRRTGGSHEERQHRFRSKGLQTLNWGYVCRFIKVWLPVCAFWIIGGKSVNKSNFFCGN